MDNMRRYAILTGVGTRFWWADDLEHAKEQHYDAISDEPILDIWETCSCAAETHGGVRCCGLCPAPYHEAEEDLAHERSQEVRDGYEGAA